MPRQKPPEKAPAPVSSFFAVLPANVRHDPKLSSLAKLLYAEITALCNASGECKVTNKYLAELYQTERLTIKRHIKTLVHAGYLIVEMNNDKNIRTISLPGWKFLLENRGGIKNDTGGVSFETSPPLSPPLSPLSQTLSSLTPPLTPPLGIPKSGEKPGFIQDIPSVICLEDLVEKWNTAAKTLDLPTWHKITNVRRGLLKKRTQEHPHLEWWEKLFAKMIKSPRLQAAPWLSLDYLIRDDTSAVKLYEDVCRKKIEEIAPAPSAGAIRLKGNSKR